MNCASALAAFSSESVRDVVVDGADHFTVLKPASDLIANKIVAQTTNGRIGLTAVAIKAAVDGTTKK